MLCSHVAVMGFQLQVRASSSLLDRESTPDTIGLAGLLQISHDVPALQGVKQSSGLFQTVFGPWVFEVSICKVKIAMHRARKRSWALCGPVYLIRWCGQDGSLSGETDSEERVRAA
jgi:hypothetical protein